MSTVTEPIVLPDAAVEPAPPSRPRARGARVALWLGLPLLLAGAAAAVASTQLIAPGVTVAGADIGWMTADAAADAIRDRVSGAEVHVAGAALTSAGLGVSVDAEALAARALGAHPLWNVTAWDPGPLPTGLALDAATAAATLRQHLPDLFADPVDARVVFDEEAGRFAADPARPGRGVDLAALETDLRDALTAGGALAAEPRPTEQEPAIETGAAEELASRLNGQADEAGFHLDGAGSLPIGLATVASWIDIAPDPAAGGFTISADVPAIGEVVAGLPQKLNRAPADSLVVTDSAGRHLRAIQAGQDGYGLASTAGLAEKVAASVEKGDLTFELQGQIIPHGAQTLFRSIEVDKSAGRTHLYENGALVASYPVAIGTGGVRDGVQTETQTGRFTVTSQLAGQHMGSCDARGNHIPGGRFAYCQPNVPWVSYFNGDQGFHGTYWHGNFGAGARMSHGCVNMTVAAAEHVYRFAQIGTEVWVHE
ncbi:hypothetical protein ASD19_13055 [Microbacterium sp. Root53]|uniref:L,D-transpeptidase n=1 Tax=Microbacterium sp. Root53 TaxID=1736553 RepID=UPI0006F22A1D|nr:L,D-transpeptidase [Microbacterium sp. Root53]KQZ06025.1 hypothetical protein ASD19_13055 [Microbacterium sp. Root53]